MSSSPSVLIYGHDARLLETRRWILERSCLDVNTVEELSGVDDITLQRHIDLLMLCHTLTFEECAAALAIAQLRWPQIKYMVLTVNDSPCAAHTADALVPMEDGPGALIADVEQLLYGRTSPTLAN